MRTFIIIAIMVLLSGLTVSAQKTSKKLVWRTGKIVLYNYEVDTKTLTYDYTNLSKGVADTQRTEKREIVARDDHIRMDVQTDEGTYIVSQDLRFIWQKKLDIKEGDSLQVAARNGFVYLKTRKGKKAKYRYVLFIPKDADRGR